MHILLLIGSGGGGSGFSRLSKKSHFGITFYAAHLGHREWRLIMSHSRKVRTPYGQHKG